MKNKKNTDGELENIILLGVTEEAEIDESKVEQTSQASRRANSQTPQPRSSGLFYFKKKALAFMESFFREHQDQSPESLELSEIKNSHRNISTCYGKPLWVVPSWERIPDLEAMKMIQTNKETPVSIQYENDEPMLMPSNDRFVMFPIEHDDIWEAYKQHMAMFWTAEEIDLSDDMRDWDELSATTSDTS